MHITLEYLKSLDWIGMISISLLIVLAVHIMIQQSKKFDNN